MAKFNFKAIIFDMDGVVYLGHHAIPGVPKAIELLRKRNVKIFFLTNNAARSRATLARRLGKMGISARKSEIITSGFAAAEYIAERKPHARVFVLGERGLKDEMRSVGLKVVGASGHPDFFVNGLDRHLTYKKLADALHVALSGAKWVCCNMDSSFPVENGKQNPGSGAIASAVIYASGRKPDVVIGKPNPKILIPILENLKHIKKEHIALVGDRLEIDVALANSAGIVSILVLTGTAQAHHAAKARGKEKPKLIIRSAAELPSIL